MKRSWTIVPLAIALVACSGPATTECDCVPPGARVHVAPESAGAVQEVRLSGPACSGATATCTQPGAVGCATYAFTPSAPGACEVDVVFSDSTFTANVTFAQASGCCAGIYPVPASAGDIEATHGPADAGGAG